MRSKKTFDQSDPTTSASNSYFVDFESFWKVFRLKTKSEQRERLQMERSKTDVHVDSAQLIISIYNDIALFANVFFAEFVYSSWHTMQSIVIRNPNGALSDESKFFRNCGGRATASAAAFLALKESTINLPDLDEF